MGNTFIAFLITISATVWLYGKFMRKSGNNTQSSVTAVVAIAIFIFVISIFVLNTIVPSA